VLRAHLCLDIPSDGNCGLIVDGEVEYHQQGQIIVFDDSKPHRAFNFSKTAERVVLIVDLVRPPSLPMGTAVGLHTMELDGFIDAFR
jgi:ornithine lipid ester-linked acyl 2-hydroxylase